MTMATAVAALVLLAAGFSAHAEDCSLASAVLNNETIEMVCGSIIPTSVASTVYNATMNTTGWAYLHVTTNMEYDDVLQAYAAGYLEGALTHSAIWNLYANQNGPSAEAAANSTRSGMWIAENIAFMQRMIAQSASQDPLWFHVNLVLRQTEGLLDGYNSRAPLDRKLTLAQMFISVTNTEFEDIRMVDIPSAERMATLHLPGQGGHCNAFLKVLPDASDILFAQGTWDQYNSMLRIMKTYTLNFNHPSTVSKTMVFSSYPGTIWSTDDFYVTDTKLVVMETMNTILFPPYDPKTWPRRSGDGVLLAWVRAVVALRMADTGAKWGAVFDQLNSGTANAMWIIADMKQWKAGNTTLSPGLIWVVEQDPDNCTSVDQTSVVQDQGYIASYDDAYFSWSAMDIGSCQTYHRGNKTYTFCDYYQNATRAVLWNVGQRNVSNLETVAALIRDSTYDNTNVTAFNRTLRRSSPSQTLSPRSDLENGPVNSYTYWGGIDTKVTTASLVPTMTVFAQSGPSTFGKDNKGSSSLKPFAYPADYNVTQSGARFGLTDVYDFTWVQFCPAQGQLPLAPRGDESCQSRLCIEKALGCGCSRPQGCK